MNLLTIILCILMKVAIIKAKTRRLPVTHSSDVNQNKFLNQNEFDNSHLTNVSIDYKILETPGEGYNYTDGATMITVKRNTSSIRLPLISSVEKFNINEFLMKSYENIRIPPENIKRKRPNFNINKYGVSGLMGSVDINETTPTDFPPKLLFSRYYLPSKSFSYNTDTSVQVRKDDYLDYVDTELKAPEA